MKYFRVKFNQKRFDNVTGKNQVYNQVCNPFFSSVSHKPQSSHCKSCENQKKHCHFQRDHIVHIVTVAVHYFRIKLFSYYTPNTYYITSPVRIFERQVDNLGKIVYSVISPKMDYKNESAIGRKRYE